MKTISYSEIPEASVVLERKGGVILHRWQSGDKRGGKEGLGDRALTQKFAQFGLGRIIDNTGFTNISEQYESQAAVDHFLISGHNL